MKKSETIFVDFFEEISKAVLYESVIDDYPIHEEELLRDATAVVICGFLNEIVSINRCVSMKNMVGILDPREYLYPPKDRTELFRHFRGEKFMNGAGI